MTRSMDGKRTRKRSSSFDEVTTVKQASSTSAARDDNRAMNNKLSLIDVVVVIRKWPSHRPKRHGAL